MNPAPAVVPKPAGTPRPPRRLLRRTLVALGIVLALLVAAALSSPWWFNARRVADLALAQADAATGLDWSYDGEPALRWRPQPWLSLPGVRARDAQARVVLAAEQLEISVPWSTLRGESLRVDAIRVVAPDIDLDAALAWWEEQPASAEPVLPRLEGLRITRGRLRWTGGTLDDIELVLPRFAIGEAMTLELRGRLQHGATTSDPINTAPVRDPFDIAVALQATPQAAPLRLEAFALELAGSGPVPAVSARGRLQFAPWSLDASGAIAAWPPAWPALPPPLPESAAPIAFTLAQQGESALAAEASITLTRDDIRVEARGIPDAVLTWLDDDDAAAIPPLVGRAAVPALELDGVRLEGVTVELDDPEIDEAP